MALREDLPRVERDATGTSVGGRQTLDDCGEATADEFCDTVAGRNAVSMMRKKTANYEPVLGGFAIVLAIALLYFSLFVMGGAYTPRIFLSIMGANISAWGVAQVVGYRRARRTLDDINEQSPIFGTALSCVFVGLIFALISAVLYAVGTPGVPRSDMVKINDAKVERVYRDCGDRSTTCWMHIEILADGRHLNLLLHDTEAARRAFDSISAGDNLTVLASQVSIGAENLWAWELKRENAMLMSYRQTADDELARNHRMRTYSYPTGGVAVILLCIGAVVGIRQGVWRSATRAE